MTQFPWPTAVPNLRCHPHRTQKGTRPDICAGTLVGRGRGEIFPWGKSLSPQGGFPKKFSPPTLNEERPQLSKCRSNFWLRWLGSQGHVSEAHVSPCQSPHDKVFMGPNMQGCGPYLRAKASSSELLAIPTSRWTSPFTLWDSTLFSFSGWQKLGF